MKKYIIAAILCVLPFTAYAPSMATNEAIVAQELSPVSTEHLYSTEHSPYVVVKDWGKYKIVHLDDALWTPLFFKRKKEAEKHADNLNIAYAKEYIYLVAQ